MFEPQTNNITEQLFTLRTEFQANQNCSAKFHEIINKDVSKTGFLNSKGISPLEIQKLARNSILE